MVIKMKEIAAGGNGVREGWEMRLIDVIGSIGLIVASLQILITVIWRFICLFIKKGSCRFVKCPFRMNYTRRSYFYFPETGCKKCPPTPEEERIWRGSLDEAVERLVEEDKRVKKERRAARMERFWKKR